MKPYQSVLDKINRIRKEFNLAQLKDLPKGIRASESSCPIGCAFEEIDPDVRINPDNIEFNTLSEDGILVIAYIFKADIVSAVEDRWIHLPDDMIDFIDDFDSGKYPELVRRE